MIRQPGVTRQERTVVLAAAAVLLAGVVTAAVGPGSDEAPSEAVSSGATAAPRAAGATSAPAAPTAVPAPAPVTEPVRVSRQAVVAAVRAVQATRTGAFDLTVTLEAEGQRIDVRSQGVFDASRKGVLQTVTFDGDAVPAMARGLVTRTVSLGTTSYLNIRKSASDPIRKWLRFTAADLAELGDGIVVEPIAIAPGLDALLSASDGTRRGRQLEVTVPAGDLVLQLPISGLRKAILTEDVDLEELTTRVPTRVLLDGRGRVVRATYDLTGVLTEIGRLSGSTSPVPAGSRLTAAVDFRGFGEPVSISAPPAAVVVGPDAFTGFD